MLAHRINATVDENHQLKVSLPADFPPGPAEVIVLAEHPQLRNLVRLGGVLGARQHEPEGDPIASALEILRRERAGSIERGGDGFLDEPSGDR